MGVQSHPDRPLANDLAGPHPDPPDDCDTNVRTKYPTPSVRPPTSATTGLYTSHVLLPADGSALDDTFTRCSTGVKVGDVDTSTT